MHFGFSYSSAILVIITIEKCFALYFPFKAKTICTVRTAKRVSLVTAVIYVAFNAQFFYFASKKNDERGTYCSYRGSETYLKFLFNIFGALYSNVPFIIMILVNCAIICKFINAKFKTGHWGTESTSQALSKSATRGTTMLLTVSFAFIILSGPIAIFQLFIGQEYPYWVFDITLTLQYMNHGINGILYCIAGSRFRNELKKIFVSRNANYQRSSRTTVLSSNCEDT